MTDIFLTTSQQPASHLPSRAAPVQDSSSTQAGIIALIIIGAIVVGVVSYTGHKRYQRYRFRRKIQALERMWQQSHRNPMN